MGIIVRSRRGDGTVAAHPLRVRAHARLAGDLVPAEGEALVARLDARARLSVEPEPEPPIRGVVRLRGDLSTPTLLKAKGGLRGTLTGVTSQPLVARLATAGRLKGDLALLGRLRSGASLRATLGSTTPTGYGYSRTLVVAPQTDLGSTFAITDYVVQKIELFGDWLKSRVNGGKVADNGADIVFKNEAQEDLDHELEAHNPETGWAVFNLRLPRWDFGAPYRLTCLYGNLSVTSVTERPYGVWRGTAASWRPDSGAEAKDSRNSLVPSGVVPSTLGGGLAGSLTGGSSLKAKNPAYFSGLQRFTLQLRVQPASLANAGNLFRVGVDCSPADADTRLLVRFVRSNTVSGVAVKNCLRVAVRFGTATHSVWTEDNSVTTTDQVFHVRCESGQVTGVWRDGVRLGIKAQTAVATGALSVLSTDEIAIGKPTDTGENGLPGLYGRVVLWSHLISATRIGLHERNLRETADCVGISAENFAADANRGAVAVPQRATVAVATPASLDYAAGCYDPDGDAVTLTGVTGAITGTASVASNKISYRSAVTGFDKLAVSVRDAQAGKVSTGRLTVIVQSGPGVGDPFADHAGPTIPHPTISGWKLPAFMRGWEPDPANPGRFREPQSERQFVAGFWAGRNNGRFAARMDYNPQVAAHNYVRYLDPNTVINSRDRLRGGPADNNYNTVQQNTLPSFHNNNVTDEVRTLYAAGWHAFACCTAPRFSTVQDIREYADGTRDIDYEHYFRRLKWSMQQVPGVSIDKVIFRPNWESTNQDTGLATSPTKNIFANGTTLLEYNSMMRRWITIGKKHFPNAYFAFSPAFETTVKSVHAATRPYAEYFADANGEVGYNMACFSWHPNCPRANTLAGAQAMVTGAGLTEGHFYWMDKVIEVAKQRKIPFASLEASHWDDGGNGAHGPTTYWGDANKLFGERLNDPANYGWVSFICFQGVRIWNTVWNPACEVGGLTVGQAHSGTWTNCLAHNKGDTFWNAQNRDSFQRASNFLIKHVGKKSLHENDPVT